MIVLGLTGSIGMGKSTTAAMFAEEGAAVHSDDAAVHALYAKGGAAVDAVAAAFAGVVRDGAVDRKALAARVVGDPQALRRLEAIVHPMVQQARARFLAEAERAGAAVAVLDIPLLFETGQDAAVDAVVVVSAPEMVQRARVLARQGMTLEGLEGLSARQLPDADKRARADFVIDTSGGLDQTRAQVRRILAAVRDPAWLRKRPLAASGEPSH
jgi:dephospho-CoA kinase